MRLKQPVSRSKNLISRSIAWHVLQLSPTDLGILTTFLCAVEFISSRCSHSGDDRDQHTFKWTFYTGGQMCVGLLNVAVMKAFRHPYMDKLCNVINLILLHGCNGLSDAFSFTFCVFSLRGFLLSMTFVYAEASIMQFFVLIPCSTLLRIKVTMSRIQPTVRSVSTFLVLEVMSVVTGVAFYFSLYLIATEGVRLYRQPQLILRDVVDLSKTEKKAFRDLPFYFDKPFSVDEHLYLLLRITKIPALRPLILARLTSVNPRIQPLSPALRSILPPVHAFGFSAPKREASIQLTPSVSRTPPGPNTPTAYQALVLRDVPAHSMRCFRSSLHSSTKCNSRIVPYSTEHALFRHYSLASHAFVRRAIHRLGENREPHLFSAYSVSENTAVSTLSDYGSSFSTYATLDCRAHFATTASSSRTLTNPCFFWLSRLCTCCRSLPHKAHSLMLSAAPTAPSDWFTSSDDSWRSGISAPLPFPTSTASSFSPSAHHQHSEADAMCNRRQQIRALPPVDVFDVRCNPSSFLHATQKYYSSSTFSGELKPKLEDIEPYFLWEFRILSLAPRSSFLSRFYRSVVSLANRTMLYFRMMDAVIKKAAAIRQAPLLPSITALGCFRDLRIQRWYWAWSSVVKARYCIAMNKIAVIASLAHTLHAVVAFAWMKHYTQQETLRSSIFWSILGVRSFVEAVQALYYYNCHNRDLFEKCTYYTSHIYNRRAAILGLSLILYATFDTVFAFSVTDAHGRLAFSSAYLALTVFPLFSRVSQKLHFVSSCGCLFLVFLFLPFCYKCVHPFIDILVLLTLQHFVVYRPTEMYFQYLFSRYLLPYLLYLDALLPPSTQLDSSFSLRTLYEQINHQRRSSRR